MLINHRVYFAGQLAIPASIVRRDLRNLLHHRFLQGKTGRWELGGHVYMSDGLVQVVVVNLWECWFSIISISVSVLSFCAAAFYSTPHISYLSMTLIMSYLAIMFTPALAFFIHHRGVVRTTRNLYRTRQDVNGMLGLDEQAGIEDRYGQRRHSELHNQKVQVLFEHLNHVHFLAMFQQFLLELSASELQETFTMTIQVVTITLVALVGDGLGLGNGLGNSAADVVFTVTSLASMRALSKQLMVILIGWSEGCKALLQIVEFFNGTANRERVDIAVASNRNIVP